MNRPTRPQPALTSGRLPPVHYIVAGAQAVEMVAHLVLDEVARRKSSGTRIDQWEIDLVAGLLDAATAAPSAVGFRMPSERGVPATVPLDAISTTTAAELLGVSTRQVRYWAARLGGTRSGGVWHFELAAVMAERNRRGGHHAQLVDPAGVGPQVRRNRAAREGSRAAAPRSTGQGVHAGVQR